MASTNHWLMSYKAGHKSKSMVAKLESTLAKSVHFCAGNKYSCDHSTIISPPSTKHEIY